MTEPTDDPAAPGDGGPEPGVGDPEPGDGGSEPGDTPGSTPLNRRRFIGWAAAAAGGVAAAAVAFGLSDSGDQGSRGSAARTGPAWSGSDAADSLLVGGGPPPGSIGIEEPHKNAAGTPLIPTSTAIIAENAKPGTAWWVTTPQRAGDIEGYADEVSAVLGETVRLFVSTKATSFRVQAYRMGYYQGIGARLVWE